MKSEKQFLDLIDTYFPRKHETLDLERGDDCAVIANGKPMCVSSDLFIEDVHFRHSYFSAEDIGYKALAVNISDIAAMGAHPVAFTMDVMAPSSLDDSFWNGFLKSMSMLAKQNDMVLAGGDLSHAEKLGVSITVFGIAPGSKRFIPRQNSSPGDLIFTVGDLGLARAGFMTLEAVGVKGREVFPAAVTAHLRPKPKVMIGSLLNAAGVSSLMDVSDGLAQDLPRLLPLNCGADITLRTESLNANLIAFAVGVGADPVEEAILGGEDYALVGTCPSDLEEKIMSIPGLTIVGSVSDTPGLMVNGAQFSAEGFDHFK